MLPAEDLRYLADKGYDYSLEQVGQATLLVIRSYALPPGFTPTVTDLLLEIPAGYPDAGLDMFWVNPEICVAASGNRPQASDVFEDKLGTGTNWQRFSRHGYPWQPGTDSIASYLGWIRRSLDIDVGALAA